MDGKRRGTPYPRRVLLATTTAWTLGQVSPRPQARSAFGGLLRHWRSRRGLSQLALSLRVETTTRHLSYLENGRSRPGRDLVLRVGDALELPLRDRNELLTAAGLPPEFPTSELTGPALAPYRGAVLQVIGAMHPFPAFVLDPMFNLEETNEAGRRLLPPNATGGTNLIETFLAPGPLRTQIANFAEVAWSWHARFLRGTATLSSPDLDRLRERVEAHLVGVPRPSLDAGGDPVVCPTFRFGETTVRTIGMTMRFGPSRDVTLEELSVDVLCPRDEEADRFFRSLATS